MDDFLPMPSLSTVPSVHLTCLSFFFLSRIVAVVGLVSLTESVVVAVVVVVVVRVTLAELRVSIISQTKN